ncbi:S41 family peptidase [Massilia cavernae]|uniref:PDZ domain-containing protein n=1 Tax=Massilia cavernae TaxID=2320864 RepID=A0A418XQG0_9BURK|nr:S41 family peptidase [Massilia cavernae]RJG14743.1 PDZ domain-containing protein [Massilia cavernae]
MILSRFAIAGFAITFALAGCGGSPGTPAVQPAPEPVPVPTPSEPLPGPATPEPPSKPTTVFLTHWNLCAAPRTEMNSNNLPYPDRQGTLADEMTFLRGWIDESYLWYREVPANLRAEDYKAPVDYFNVLKTSALTASGKPKDKYHFSYDSARWEALNSKGVEFGYGVAWSRSTNAGAPRTWLVTTVEPGAPADAAGLRRGDQLLTVDGVDFVNTADADAIAKINAGLFPKTLGEVHQLTVNRKGTIVHASLAASSVSTVPVKNTKVIDTPTGKVGYLTFANHNAVSELQLIESIELFKAAQIDDLVLDVRYNGGGLLYIASQLAYMIAGPDATTDQVFEQPIHNDKITRKPPIPFRATAYGFAAPRRATAGMKLPYLGLKRVTLLTTPGTCSASESIINSLRGVDVEVNLVGGQTCGKPYAFTPTPNCGTTYFAIEFMGVNAKGFGDFADGFAPTCAVPDDLDHALGDTQEGMLAAALKYRETNACPAPAAAMRASARPLQLVREPVDEISIYTRPR